LVKEEYASFQQIHQKWKKWLLMISKIYCRHG
jgi:hypothetical protein